jgi:Glyoxalase-like domain
VNLGDGSSWSIAAFLLSAVALARAQPPGAKPADPAGSGAAHIDHVILGIGNLEQGIRAFTKATGVVPQRGGEHPGRGTANALVSLGTACYLEILAPAGAGSSAEHGKRQKPVAPGGDTDLGTLQTLTPIGWAVGTKDLDGLLARLATSGFQLSGPIPGSRRRPDGLLLKWRTAQLGEPGIPLAPFFIEWSAETPHPSNTSPPGCELVGIELADPAPKQLDQLLSAAGVTTRPKPARERRMVLTLTCPRGRVTFDSRGH